MKEYDDDWFTTEEDDDGDDLDYKKPWGIYNDELYGLAEDYAVAILRVQEDCMDLFRLEECNGICKECLLHKQINGYHTGIDNINKWFVFYDYFDDAPFSLDELLKDYKNNYGWKIIKCRNQR